jgi:hypothetical protein
LVFTAYEILRDSSELLNRRFPSIVFCELEAALRGHGGASMLSGPKGSEEQSLLRCSVCGRRTELFELPGKSDKYCWECSADVATSILLTTEIDAATMAGRETETLVAEFSQLSCRLLERAQLA